MMAIPPAKENSGTQDSLVFPRCLMPLPHKMAPRSARPAGKIERPKELNIPGLTSQEKLQNARNQSANQGTSEPDIGLMYRAESEIIFSSSVRMDSETLQATGIASTELGYAG